ncbi:MAG: polysaccharide deacetylase family protein [Bacillota bacterium]
MKTPIIILRKRMIARFFCLALIGVLLWIVWQLCMDVYRTFEGVKPGVRLESRLVERMLPAELVGRIKEMAYLYEREPRNAIYFEETGEVIPAQPGIKVDIMETVRKVRSAPCNAHLRICTITVKPAITEDYFAPVFRGPDGKAGISLTFNVDWGEEYIPALLDILNRYRVRATFFLTGSWTRKNTALARKIAAQGHEVANHGYSHEHIIGSGRNEVRELIVRNEKLLKEVCGRCALLFAPPYGEWDTMVVTTAGNLGYRTVLWTIDTVDWQKPLPATIEARVKARLASGSIILMHPTDPTVKALPAILNYAASKGFTAMPVTDLLKKE